MATVQPGMGDDPAPGAGGARTASSTPLRPVASPPARTAQPSPRTDAAGRRLDHLAAAQQSRRITPSSGGSGSDSDRRLIVGRYISLSGEINACDHLEVEGRIEAKLSDCQTIYIFEEGVFKGSAEVDTATIAGRFEGDLLVRGRLSLIGTGVVEGNTRYGELQVDAGGRLIGTLQPLETAAGDRSESDD